jgi:hypothetical protein
MTLPQAQVFVRRWRRVLLPWLHLPDAVAARAMERSFLGIAVAPLPAIFIVTVSGSLPLSRWPLSVTIPAFTIMLLSYWLSLRFRAARRLVEEADGQRLSDLRKHLYDKPSA